MKAQKIINILLRWSDGQIVLEACEIKVSRTIFLCRDTNMTLEK